MMLMRCKSVLMKYEIFENVKQKWKLRLKFKGRLTLFRNIELKKLNMTRGMAKLFQREFKKWMILITWSSDYKEGSVYLHKKTTSRMCVYWCLIILIEQISQSLLKCILP